MLFQMKQKEIDMKKLIGGAFLAILLAGCSGLEITTLNYQKVNDAHDSKKTTAQLNGYVVYEPMLVFQVSLVCADGKTDISKCADSPQNCIISAPILLPDYSKPYLVRSKNGFGKSGVDMTIVDGWRLGETKDESDNSAILDVIAKAAGVKMLQPNSSCNVGVYRWSSNKEDGQPTLQPLTDLFKK